MRRTSVIAFSLHLWATWDIISIFRHGVMCFVQFVICRCFCPFQKAKQPLVRQGVLIIGASRSHSDTPPSVGLLPTSDQLIVKNSTWQHNTLKGPTYTFSTGFDHNPSKSTPTDTRLIPRGNWHWLQKLIWTFRCILHSRTYISKRTD